MKWYKQVQGQAPIEVIDDDKHVINQLLSHGQQLSISEIWYQMTIINIQGNDYGNYTCQGTNRLGVGKYDIVVYETSECQGANCPPEGGLMSKAPTRSMPTLLTLGLAVTVFVLLSLL